MTFVVDIVTGASAGIGRSIAEYIAHQRSNQILFQPSFDYRLVLVGRNTERGGRAVDTIANSSGLDASCVQFEQVDVGNWNDVTRLKDRILEGTQSDFQVGILVNNAAECPRTQEFVKRNQKQDNGQVSLTKVDKQFATNVLGYHFMMKMLEDHFSSNIDFPTSSSSSNTASASPTITKSHIVNVASNWAGDLDLNDLQFQRRRYDNDSAYRQSKQCDRMLSKVWSQKLQNVALVNSCHPGDPCTTLSKALGYNLGCSPPTRAMIERETPIPFLSGLVAAGDGVATTGGWYQGRSTKPLHCQFAHKTKEASRLYDICDNFAVGN